MTDIENKDDTTEEKVLNDFAKLRASLKTKYEGQIKDLQKEIDELKGQRLEDKKTSFRKTLQSQGYKGDDFDEFAEKYGNMELDEMEALYKGMHGNVETKQAPTDNQNQDKTLGPKSVIGSNPNLTDTEVKPEDMNLDDYFNYAKGLIQ